jgi:hypothetical protein
MPFTGEVNIEECMTSVRSVELQLVRVETIDREGYSTIREATEVQNIQITYPLDILTLYPLLGAKYPDC